MQRRTWGPEVIKHIYEVLYVEPEVLKKGT